MSATPAMLNVTAAARLLGVHPNTVRAWTDQGRLHCVRINGRGDRRYSSAELQRFLGAAGSSALPASATGAGESSPAEPRQPSLLARSAQFAAGATGIDDALSRIAALLGDAGYPAVAFRSSDGTEQLLAGDLPVDAELARRAARLRRPVLGRAGAQGGTHAALPLVNGNRVLGVLQLGRTALALVEESATDDQALADLAALCTATLEAGMRAEHSRDQLRRFEMLHAVSSDIGSQLDLDRILSQLLDYAVELFAADHAGVLRRLPNGSFLVDQARNMSAEFRQAIEHAPALPLTQQAFEEGQVVSASGYPDDSRGIPLRHAMMREGVNTVTAAPLVSDGELLGALVLYHDEPYEWTAEDRAQLEQFARMGAVAIKNARNYGQMATWAAQLQSIQQLGSRLTRLNTVNDIGQAICAELNQLIRSHNVRVYRVEGHDVVPVAWRGDVGEYTGEDGTQLRVRVGQGITGWVARYGVAQNLGDAAADRRTETIPGTEDDLDESLLLAPMLFEDEVIGVIVLAKLGLHQFTADDLRLLEIYASIAAQAMANADATEQLRAQSEALARQLQSQRELLRVTESILSTLDAQQLLDEIAERLEALLPVDNLAVQLYDHDQHSITPLFARGVHAETYMKLTFTDDFGLSSHVLRTNEAQLVQDVLSDPRVGFIDDVGPLPGAAIIAPLRARDRVMGLLMVNRLGEAGHFSDEEFELVKLFAGHVSIALNNAEAHRAVELRAETDPLTDLKNHGTLLRRLGQAIDQGGTFSLLMIDLDGFKGFNDELGHEAGNVALQRLAHVLRGACRDNDEVFRYGGDEFAIILPGTSLAGARRVGDKVLNAIRETDTSSGSGRITGSIGIAAFPLDGTDRGAILRAADRACYAAKRAGRDRVLTGEESLALAEETNAAQPARVA